MTTLHRAALLFFAIVSCFTLTAQTVGDGFAFDENIVTRMPIPHDHIRQADVMWGKRVWRVMDLKQKMNLPYYYPLDEDRNQRSLFKTIKSALEDSMLTAYGTGPLGDDDEFKTILSGAEIMSILHSADTLMTPDPDSGEMVPQVIYNDINSEDIIEYKIKEDWFFDKQTSQMKVRIIGIAPRVVIVGEDGELRGKKDLFWLYFPECRYVFANAAASNPNNDWEKRSFDDLFQKRIFASYIVKESNVYDRNIRSYATGLDHLLESERIKAEIDILEQDLWSY